MMRKISETVFVVGEGAAAAVPLIAGLALTATCPFTGGLAEGASRLRCSLGAILTSVFVVNSNAFPLEGSRPALGSLNLWFTRGYKDDFTLTHSKSNARPAQHPDIYFLAHFRDSDLRK